jgi:hypothetical protein
MPQVAAFRHVALPPAGAGHAVQEDPQLLGLSLGTQKPPQLCVPAGQACPQKPLLQVANPPAGAAQAVHDAPQALASLFATQPLPQR